MTSQGIIMPAAIPDHVKASNPATRGFNLQLRARDKFVLRHVRQGIMRMTNERGLNATSRAISRIEATPDCDYEFRMYTTAYHFGEWMRDEIGRIDYTKFKPTTERKGGGGAALHHLYDSIWGVIATFYDSRILTRR